MFYGNNIAIIKKEEDCTVYKMKDVTGEDTWSVFRLNGDDDTIFLLQQYLR